MANIGRNQGRAGKPYIIKDPSTSRGPSGKPRSLSELESKSKGRQIKDASELGGKEHIQSLKASSAKAVSKFTGKKTPIALAHRHMLPADKPKQMSPKTIQALQKAGYSPYLHPYVEVLDAEHALTQFGSGAVGSVYSMKTQEGETILFKPDEKLTLDSAPAYLEGSDIPMDNPKSALRSWITYASAEFILEGSSLPNPIVPSNLAVINGEVGLLMGKAPGLEGAGKAIRIPVEDAKFEGYKMLLDMRNDEIRMGSSSEEAQRNFQASVDMMGLQGVEEQRDPQGNLVGLTQESFESAQFKLDDPALKKQMDTLNTLDFLGAQLDRHLRNFRVEQTQKGVRVTAYDNDLCRGSGLCDTQDSTYEDKINVLRQGNVRAHIAHLPPDMDKEVAQVFAGIDKELYRGFMENKGLTSLEVDAEMNRLKHVQSHCQKILNDEPMPPRTEDNSYFERLKAVQEEYESPGIA